MFKDRKKKKKQNKRSLNEIVPLNSLNIILNCYWNICKGIGIFTVDELEYNEPEDNSAILKRGPFVFLL